jgi:hypothetical protein
MVADAHATRWQDKLTTTVAREGHRQLGRIVRRNVGQHMLLEQQWRENAFKVAAKPAMSS